jgi:PTS system ascorbate-specific IIB component
MSRSEPGGRLPQAIYIDFHTIQSAKNSTAKADSVSIPRKETKMPNNRRVNILTVCGVGSGSSLILRMYVEDVLDEFKIRYSVQAGQASEAKGSKADIIMCAYEFLSVTQGATAKVVPIKSFTDKGEIKQALNQALTELQFI